MNRRLKHREGLLVLDLTGQCQVRSGEVTGGQVRTGEDRWVLPGTGWLQLPPETGSRNCETPEFCQNPAGKQIKSNPPFHSAAAHLQPEPRGPSGFQPEEEEEEEEENEYTCLSQNHSLTWHTWTYIWGQQQGRVQQPEPSLQPLDERLKTDPERRQITWNNSFYSPLLPLTCLNSLTCPIVFHCSRFRSITATKTPQISNKLNKNNHFVHTEARPAHALRSIHRFKKRFPLWITWSVRYIHDPVKMSDISVLHHIQVRFFMLCG